MYTLTCNSNLFLRCDPTHQLDLPVAHDGAEFAEVPHETIEDVSDAFPLLTTHFLHPRQLCLQLHKTGLLHVKREEERVRVRISEALPFFHHIPPPENS